MNQISDPIALQMLLERNPDASEAAKNTINGLIKNHVDLVYEKHIDQWDTFFVINKDQPAGNPQTWNAKAGPSQSSNYL